MEQKTVPTSPNSDERKQREAKREQKKAARDSRSHPHLVFIIIVLILIFGSVSGFFGFLIAVNIPADVPILGELSVVSIFEQERQDVLLSARQRERSIIKQAPQVIDQTAVIYSDNPTVEKPAEFIGNATLLTSDGWLVTPTDLLPKSEEGADATPLKKLAIVLADGTSKNISETITDDFSGLTFIKVKASNLPFVSFEQAQSIPVGQSVSVIEKEIGSFVVYERRAAGELLRSNAVRHTTELNQFTLLDKSTNINRTGSPVFTSAGNLIGLILTDGSLVQASLIEGALESIINEGEIMRSAKDISYINIARLTDEEKEQKSLPENGILITKVAKGEKKLKSGDVITSINSSSVDEAADLGVALHSRPAKTTLFFTVLRIDKEPAKTDPDKENMVNEAEKAATNEESSKSELVIEYVL